MSDTMKVELRVRMVDGNAFGTADDSVASSLREDNVYYDWRPQGHQKDK
jgi:hypothetical protein